MIRKPHAIHIKLATLGAIIIAFGLLMLTSASQVLGLDTFQDPYYYFQHQFFFGILPGLIVLILFTAVNYEIFQKLSTPIFVLSLLLLILVFVPELGFAHGGARRWVHIGSVSIQPSEIVKLSLIIFFAAWFAHKKSLVRSFHYTFLPFLLYLGLIIIPIVLQPDIGTLSVIVAIAMSIYFVAGIKPSHGLLLVTIAVAAFAFLIYMAPYRLARLTTFLNRDTDSLGTSYQINQSLLAIGSGGIFGVGFGQSKQKYQYLPEVAGDSIFAIIGEELGFVFTSIFVLLYLYFVFTGYRIAALSPEPFLRYSAIGITTWFAYQGMVNMGAMLNFLPLTGLPLPFVSYGSSALIISLAAFGFLLNISRYTKTRN